MNKHVLIFIFTFFSTTGFCIGLQDARQLYFEPNKDQVRINTISYSTDTPLSTRQFFHLVGFSHNATISFSQLKKAFKRLGKMQQFSAIELNFSKHEDQYNLHFQLSGAWLLHQVLIKGILFNRERYAALYLAQPGSVFDVAQHEESVKAIRAQLREDGYFDCQVKDVLYYDAPTKTITVKIKLVKGKRARVGSVYFALSGMSKDESGLTQEAELSRMLNEKVGKRMLGRSYNHFSLTKHREMCKEMLAKLGYSHARIKAKTKVDATRKVSVYFIVKLGKRMRVNFSGNTAFETEFLTTSFVENQPPWLLTPAIISEQITALYRLNGYKDVRVEVHQDSSEFLLLYIHEGQPTKIQLVNVLDEQGEIVYAPSFIESLTGSVFEEKGISQALEKLQNYFVSLGYSQCSLRYDAEKKNQRATLNVYVKKGKQQLLNQIYIMGVDDDVVRELEKKLSKEENEEASYFRPDQLAIQLEQIRHFLHKKGYWYADITHELTTELASPQTELVNVTWHINPGEIVRFGKIILSGTSMLPFDKVRAELPFKPGEKWDEGKIQLARSRLENLGIFKQVKVQAYDILQSEAEKDVQVVLDQDSMFELRLRGGYFLTSKNFLFKQQSTYKVGGAFIVRNPTNAADTLSTQAEITRFERRFDVDYQRPRLFGSSTLGSMKVYSSKYVHPLRLGNSESAYEADQHGVLASVSNQYKKDYHWGFSCGHEWIRTSRVRGNLKLSKDIINRMLPYVFFEPSIVFDAVDNRLDPTIGGITFGSLKLMLPYKKGDVTYKMLIEHSLFYPLAHRVVGAFRVRWGHIFRQAFANIMPIDRFYLGGPHTVRGYEKDAMPPLGVSCVEQKDGKFCREFTIQGGSSMFNLNLELRIGLFNQFSFVIFHDVGVLSQRGMAPFDGNWLPATGIGFRYATPIGPIRFDVGRKWKKQIKEQSTFVWYLTLGHAF